MKRLLRIAASAAVVSSLLPAPCASASADVYQNPVSSGFADTFADPAVIRGHDGAWYAYGTSDPLRSGEGTPHRIPTARSTDLVHWSHVGDALATAAFPPYASSSAVFWAPDVRYLDGHYVMYVAVTDTDASPGDWDPAIGAATAPTPTGPWTFSDRPVVAPRKAAGGDYEATIDPSEFTDVDGRRYLYWGSYGGGVHVTELSADGLHAVGTPVQVAVNNRFEGSYVIRHGGYYYLFASSANCCAGPATGYSVSVGRATNPRGPFTDRDGVRLESSRPGGTPVVWPNGGRWIGTGHNAVLSDLSGQDWLVYHAIDPATPYLDKPFDVNRRPMLIDRLDWIDGWPVVRAGQGPSDRPEAAPVTHGVSIHWHAQDGWSVTGGLARHSGDGHAELTALTALPPDRRVEADLRVGAGAEGGLIVADHTTVRVDTRRARLVAESGGVTHAVPLPHGFDAGDWHNLAVEVRGRTVTASLTQDRLADPLAEVNLTAPRPPSGRVGLLADGGPVDAADLSAARLFRPVTHAVPDPRAGAPLPAYSDEFDGSAPGWTWVRRDAAATVSGGSLNWPVEGSDLVGTENTAGVLLHDTPQGDYVAETKLTLDLGENTVRNYQQAGLIVYAGDDDFARFGDVAIENTRQLEFGRELPYADGLTYGGTQFGTTATTVWLRLAHRIDPATGRHDYRAASSRDGRHWTWGSVWTFPASGNPRIGLVAQGGATPAVTATFDYLRFYRG
jgi:arabinan endo-1,5-alpha-L-arabinosidase